ncbi:glycosyltransferase family 2 protein [Roseomonas sp. HJA6]|uniref:Glycosyltransferase family 2 protein n=1 Tax=Roseomonas alba TaxID=2846776 RepID=A0ABS7A6H3_9PROT|nr:glycosyltransferase family 2 protein [Neoroseomonas alba]
MTVVTVTHDSRDAIGGFLAALPADLALVVVDNASADGTPDRVASLRPSAQVIRNRANRGFGAGCNAGLDVAATEFALLLNPDARLAPGTLETLVDAADRFPDAAILAPTILGRDGHRVRSYETTRARRPLLPRRRDAEPWPEGPACFDFVSGAAMLLRLAQGLRFDESLFLFYEDDALCAEARARGHSVVLVPDARVEHAGGTSSPPSLRIRWRKAYHMALSRQVFGARHGHADAPQRLLRHGGKAIGHALTLRGTKALEDLAGLAGTLIWLGRRRR